MAKIMVVDDEKELLMIVKRILEREGFKVIPCERGEECLDRINSEKPDLVLLDVMMPGMSGFEVCRYIKKMEGKEGIAVAMFTVLGKDEATQRGFEFTECDAYLKKPLRRRELVDAVKGLLKCPV
jgi:DNA-binding response OmpR family regulator